MPVNDRKSQDRNDSGLLIWQDTMKSNIFCWKEALLVKLNDKDFRLHASYDKAFPFSQREKRTD